APAPVARVVSGTDYAVDSHWLCRPGRDDICAQPLTAEPQGGGAAQLLRPDPAAPIDCFYVYPTISFDATANSDLVAGAEERRAAQQQLAPFGGTCRTFAPMYRQVTLAAVRSRFTGTPMQPDAAMAYADVKDAWNDYLARDNKGRGVVLIGHSQGARMLAELVAREIEGKPVQRQIVSALLLGMNLAVPKGRDAGGAFKSMPLCRSATQIGCVVAYTSFRADSPPPADSLFGRIGATSIGGTDPAAFTVACTNPAALAGGSGKLLAVLPLGENLLGQAASAGAPTTAAKQPTATRFTARTLPVAECVESGGASYLSVNFPSDLQGELSVNGQVLRTWGLHLVDVNVATGNLVQLLKQQARVHAGSR
ncbi:MAG: hypothetical protein RLZZ618_347, partial [Pseudomonadota bacterium]